MSESAAWYLHEDVTRTYKYTDQEMMPARNARNVVTLVTIQRENILPSKITD
jgi:hypothetical protein